MRLCFNCYRLNPGRPQLCAYCGRSWQGKLCQKGHVSPPDAAFCSTCGSTSFFPASPGAPIWLRLAFLLLVSAGVYLFVNHLPAITTGLARLSLRVIILLIPFICLFLMFPAGIRSWLLKGLRFFMGLIRAVIKGILQLFFGVFRSK